MEASRISNEVVADPAEQPLPGARTLTAAHLMAIIEHADEEIVWPNSLGALERYGGKTTQDDVDTIKAELDKLDNPVLNKAEINLVLNCVKGWKYYQTAPAENRKSYAALYKTYNGRFPEIDCVATTIEGRRVVRWNGPTLILFAENITVEDMKLIIDTEKEFLPDNSAHEAGFGALNEKEALVVSLLYLDEKGIAKRSGIPRGSIASYIHRAKQKQGHESTLQLAKQALADGLININDVPGGKRKASELGSDEQELLRDFYDKTHQEAAEHLDKSLSAISRLWQGIYEHLGVGRDKRCAYFAAIKEGFPMSGDETET